MYRKNYSSTIIAYKIIPPYHWENGTKKEITSLTAIKEKTHDSKGNWDNRLFKQNFAHLTLITK